nr:hypothetical protein [Tanacetum cinerariifolium]
MWETNSYKAYEDHMVLYEALEKSMNRDHTEELLTDLVKARRKKKKGHDSPKTPPGSPPHQLPPPSPPTRPSGTLGSPRAFGSSQVPPSPLPHPSINQLKPSVSSIPEDLHIDDDMAPNAQVHSSDDEDIENAHILKVNLQQDWWKPFEEDRPATPEPACSIPSYDMPTGGIAMFMDWFCKRQRITKLKPQDLEGPAFKLVKVFHPNQTTTTGWSTWSVTIQSDFFFNKDLEYLRYDSKGGRPALSILKMKAAYYLDVSLEQMVPDQMWIEEECKYDIAAMYDISHWWDKYGVQMIMRFNEIHKFSFGTLHQIDEALDYRVKEFKVNRMNLGLSTRFWTRKDVDRSKEFMLAIQKRLKTKRIFRNLESFVCGREKSKNKRRVPTEMELELEQSKQVKMEIMLEPTSNKLLVDTFGKPFDVSQKSLLSDARLIFKSISHQSVGFNSLVHSLHALSTLRRSGLRTASAVVKPYQGDSSKLYLITGIPTVAAAGQRDVNLQTHAHTSISLSKT